MRIGTLDDHPTPTQLAEAMVYVDHPCDPGCCPEAGLRLYISIYGGDNFDPHTLETSVSFSIDAFPLSVDDTEAATRATVAAIITEAERRATARSAELVAQLHAALVIAEVWMRRDVCEEECGHGPCDEIRADLTTVREAITEGST